MILKSLIILSMIFNSFGLSRLSDRFDAALMRQEFDPSRSVGASDASLELPAILARPEARKNAFSPNIYAKQYLLADKDSGKILLKNGIADQVPIASTTKIMSAVVVLENYDLNQIVTVSEAAANQVGADAHLRAGEQLRVIDLLKAMLIKSANGAAYALAENMNQADETGCARFVAAMNKKAKELGMVNTDYHDPAGLDTAGYSSAYDLFLATKYALDKPIFAGIVKTNKDAVRSIDGQIWHELDNSNRLIGEYNYPGAIGVKTGYMPEAGHVLVSAATRDGHTLIGVVINTFADTAPASADESRKTLDWGFANIVWQ